MTAGLPNMESKRAMGQLRAAWYCSAHPLWSRRRLVRSSEHNLTKECSRFVGVHLIEKLASVLSQPGGKLSILEEIVILVDALYLHRTHDMIVTPAVSAGCANFCQASFMCTVSSK